MVVNMYGGQGLRVADGLAAMWPRRALNYCGLWGAPGRVGALVGAGRWPQGEVFGGTSVLFGCREGSWRGFAGRSGMAGPRGGAPGSPGPGFRWRFAIRLGCGSDRWCTVVAG